ncbi:MAG: winged helix-turn-helix transcriptional regulator [Thermoproteales archaeon]|nr:winged helix-turn-helix transcriptional regulator [Thermoproteales archaeon]RLE65635.1 MAG: hypothetical protein DRJ47_04695 [Thermoprotei archaeon]
MTKKIEGEPADEKREKELIKIYSILAHPVKRKIIQYLGRKKSATATELRNELKVSTGALYYSLDDLAGYVGQNEDRRYFLTPKGYKLYELMISERERLREILPERERTFNSVIEALENVLIPYIPFRKLRENNRLLLFLSTVLFLVSLTGVMTTDMDVTFLSVSDSRIFNPFHANLGPLGIAVKFILNWVGVFLLLEVFSRISGSRNMDSDFFLATFVSLAPSYLYPYVSLAVNMLLLSAFWKSIILTLLLRILQITSLCFLTASLTVFKHLRKDLAFILSSILFYISLFLEIQPFSFP